MRVTKKLTRGDITKIILETVKVSSILTTAILAPKVITALKKLDIVDLGQRKLKSIENTKFRMIRKGYLKKNKNNFLCLTESGLEKLRKFELNNYELIIPKIWDKKWRVLIFDIPESRRYIRQKVRNTLRSIGFYRLQDSVWVFPYDCSELVTLLKADFKIGKDLLYLIVEEMENDRKVKEYFNLI